MAQIKVFNSLNKFAATAATVANKAYIALNIIGNLHQSLAFTVFNYLQSLVIGYRYGHTFFDKNIGTSSHCQAGFQWGLAAFAKMTGLMPAGTER